MNLAELLDVEQDDEVWSSEVRKRLAERCYFGGKVTKRAARGVCAAPCVQFARAFCSRSLDLRA